MKTKFTIVTALLALAGCASTEVKEVVNQDYNTGEQQVNTARAQVNTKPPIILPVSNVPYLGSKSIAAVDKKAELPRILRNGKLVKFNPVFVLSAENFGKLVAEETGLPVKVTLPPQPAHAGAAAAATPLRTVNLAALPPMKWPDLLDAAMTSLGLDWEWNDGVLQIQSTFTRVYAFDKSASKSDGKMELGKTATSTVGTSQGGSGTSGNFNSELKGKTESVSDPWTDVTASLKVIAGDANVIPNPALSRFVVKCSKACHKDVKAFMDDANYGVTQQVLFSVVEITVASTRTGQSGVNWNLVYQRAGGGKSYSLNSPTSLVGTSAGNIGIKIFDALGIGGKEFDGSQAVFNAISAASKVVDAKPYDLMALNNEATTLANTDQQTYTQQTTVVPTGTNGTPVYSEVPGYVTYGQLIQVIPTVLSGGRVILRFGLDDTKLKSITKGERQGQIDKVLLGALNSNNQAVIKSGRTLVLTGFKRKTSTINEQGMFANQKVGSEDGNTDYTETLIMITPHVVGS